MLADEAGVSLVRRESGVLVLTVDRNENKINPEYVAALARALDAAEKAEHPKALVVTGVGKFFGNGLDVEWMAANPADATGMIQTFFTQLAKLLTMNCHTVQADPACARTCQLEFCLDL